MVYGWVEMWTASTASRWAASRAALLDVRMVVMMASWSVAGMVLQLALIEAVNLD